MAIDKLELRILRTYEGDTLQFRTYDGSWMVWDDWQDVPIVDSHDLAREIEEKSKT